MIGMPETLVELNSCDKPIPFRCHVVHEFGVKLYVGHRHLDGSHVIDQLVESDVIVSDAFTWIHFEMLKFIV